MNRRSAGLGFIFIAAILYATKYIAAAIFGSGVMSWNADLFQAMLSCVGNALNNWSLLALIMGILYLVWAEVTTSNKSKKSDQS